MSKQDKIEAARRRKKVKALREFVDRYEELCRKHGMWIGAGGWEGEYDRPKIDRESPGSLRAHLEGVRGALERIASGEEHL